LPVNFIINQSILCLKEKTKIYRSNLVLASRASRGISGLGVGGTLIGLSTLDHHDGEADISTRGVLVAALTRVDSTGIGAVSIPSLEGVEVGSRAGCAGVPHGVNILLGVVVEHLSVVLSVVGGGAEGGGTDSEGRVRGERRSASDSSEGKESLDL
jgi:hypothetical protein